MVNIGKMHIESGDGRAISRFFRSSGFKTAQTHLRTTGVGDRDISHTERPFVGQPSEAHVHPVVALEYVRWLNYADFVKLAVLGDGRYK